jgi:competence ComEA-like helix-hairpin-helix protein
VASRGKPGSSWLLISAILLVWNAGASARHFFGSGPLFFASSPDPADRSPNVPDLLPSSFDNVSARSGPLSLRQKYLLGKRVDINKATLEEISELPGISDAVAAAVVAERERIGRFRSPGDLLEVRGIKAKRLKKILPFLAEMKNN